MKFDFIFLIYLNMSLEGYCSNDTLYLKYKDYRGKIPYKEVMQKPDEIKLLMDFINGSQKTKYESVNGNMILTTTIPSGLTEKTIKVELLGIDTYFEKIDRLEKRLDILTKLLKEKEDNINVGEFTVYSENINMWCKEFKPYIYSMKYISLGAFGKPIYLIKAKLFCIKFHIFELTKSKGQYIELHDEINITQGLNLLNNNEFYKMKLINAEFPTYTGGSNIYVDFHYN